MPLIREIDDPKFDTPRFAQQLNRLDHRSQFIREIASVILSCNQDFESVWSIANRVYDRHCLPKARPKKARRGPDELQSTALSA